MNLRWKWRFLKLLPLGVAYVAAAPLSLTRSMFLVLGVSVYGLMCAEEADQESEEGQ